MIPGDVSGIKVIPGDVEGVSGIKVIPSSSPPHVGKPS